jgi:hypothetical protein
MFCASCGKQILDDSTFCGGCGKRLSEEPKKSRPGWAVRILVAIGIVLVAIVVLRLIPGMVKSSDGDKSISELPRMTSPDRSQPIRQERAEPLFVGTEQIPAHNLTWKCFNVPPALENPTLVGTFQAVGGIGNDIQFVIATEEEFNVWRNTKTGTLLYDSGRMIVGNVEFPFPSAGRYCAGFSNAWSMFSGKSVSTDLKMKYAIVTYPR